MSVSTLTPAAPATAVPSAVSLRDQLAAVHDPATVDAVLAAVAGWLAVSTEAGRDRVARHGYQYTAGWAWRGTSAAKQLTAAVPAAPAVRIPHQRTAA